jgi:peptidoglycan/LPS O-acetylase OafA/YrhL
VANTVESKRQIEPKHQYVARRRERTRTRVMYFLLAILLLTIVGTFCLVWFEKTGAPTFTQTALPLLTTLVGTALGFYFGGQNREDEDEDMDGNNNGVTEKPKEAQSIESGSIGD